MDIDKQHSDDDVLSTLSSQTSSTKVQSSLSHFGTLSSRKLWHQLSVALLSFLRESASETAHLQVALWDGFISVHKRRMDQLRVVEMATLVSGQYEDPASALSFLQSVQSSVDTPSTVTAHLLATTESAHFSLLLGDLSSVSSALASSQRVLDTLDDVPPVVHASFYRVSGDLHKSKAEYVQYYRNSLLYLACVDLEALSKEERVSRAHDLGIAALLGDTIYNFGELLLHPILQDLQGTQYEWLQSLLYAFNAGSLGKFESLVPYLEQEPILSTSLDFLRPKICLMSLISLLFSLPSSSRSHVPFSQIASSTQLPVEEVEHLIMKALSLQLVKGDIDQVEQEARVSWVQPRVLGMQEIGELSQRLGEWSTKVRKVGENSVRGNEVLLVQ